MPGTLTLVTAPATEPLTVAQVADHLRLDQGNEDDYLESLISAARELVESETNRALITQTWEISWNSWPRFPIELPKSPLVSVTSVKYLDDTGTETTWSASNYRVKAFAGPRPLPGRVSLAYGITLPTNQSVSDSIVIRYVAGYGAATSVPKAIKQAILLVIGEMYARREDGTQAKIESVPLGAHRLLTNFRVA